MSQENNHSTEEKNSPRKRGGQTTFTQPIADHITFRIANGETLRAVCRDINIPPSTVIQWTHDNPEFNEQYAQARLKQADVYADMIVDEAFSSHDASIGRLRMDALKWVASKLAPKRYGDKVEIEAKGESNLQISFAIPERKVPITLEENKRIEDAE